MRHKKFFNQVFSEVFFMKICIVYDNIGDLYWSDVINVFNAIDTKLSYVGSNLLFRSKISISFLNVYSFLYLNNGCSEKNSSEDSSEDSGTEEWDLALKDSDYPFRSSDFIDSDVDSDYEELNLALKDSDYPLRQPFN